MPLRTFKVSPLLIILLVVTSIHVHIPYACTLKHPYNRTNIYILELCTKSVHSASYVLLHLSYFLSFGYTHYLAALSFFLTSFPAQFFGSFFSFVEIPFNFQSEKLMAADSLVYDGPLLISAPGKVILFGEHAVVYKKVFGSVLWNKQREKSIASYISVK